MLSSLLSLCSVDPFLHQQGIDTTRPGGKAMFKMLGVFAERSIIQSGCRAGLRLTTTRSRSGPRKAPRSSTGNDRDEAIFAK